jgi:di/tricarboxylate transporter
MWTAFATTAVTSSLFLTALAPNAAALAIAKKIVGVDVGWSQWFIGFAPLGIPLLLLVPLLSYAGLPAGGEAKPGDRRMERGELAEMGPPSRNEWIMAGAGAAGDVPVDHGSNPDHQPAGWARTSSTRPWWCSS